MESMLAISRWSLAEGWRGAVELTQLLLIEDTRTRYILRVNDQYPLSQLFLTLSILTLNHFRVL